MAIQQVTAYLSFNGTAEAAIQHYTRALGAEVEGKMRWAEMPMEGGEPPATEPRIAEEDRDRIMHATLRFGSGKLMLSDVPRDHPTSAGSNVHIALDFDDEAELARKFDALAEGGNALQPPVDAFWGGKFGILVDKFGVQWMFTSSAAHR